MAAELRILQFVFVAALSYATFGEASGRRVTCPASQSELLLAI